MKLIRLVTLVALSLLVVIPVVSAHTAKPAAKAAPAAQAADPAATLPAPILAAFKKSYPNATVKNAAKETEDGKTVWEVESIDGGLARDLIYNPDGTVVEFEEQIDAATLPAAVSAALKAKYPKATITKAEKLMKAKAVTYEMALKDAAVPSIEITPDGKIVPATKEKDEKEDDEKAEQKDGRYKLLTEIKVGSDGGWDYLSVDSAARRLYVSHATKAVVLNTATHAVAAKWPIAPGEGASGLSIDLANHRLFAVAGNNLLVALDSTTGKVLSTLPIGPGVDATSFDPATGYVFASSSDSTLTVATCDKAGKLSLVQTLATPARSRAASRPRRARRSKAARSGRSMRRGSG